MRATAMLMTIAGMLLLPVLFGATAEAQVIFPGSTPEGDYLRGVGIGAAGMGQYNLDTAQANQINAQTFIMLNEYIWTAYKNEMREKAEHRKAMLAKHAEAYRQRQEQIRNHPTRLDVRDGTALNQVLEDLKSPDIQDTAARLAKVPLDAGVIRRIPFRLPERGEKFCMGRLTLEGRWVVAFQDKAFNPFRSAYKRAVDNALEHAYEGRVEDKKVIDDVIRAVEDLEQMVRQSRELRDPRKQALYSEAREQLDQMRNTARLFQRFQLQAVFREIDTYTGTTVDDLRRLMQEHNLTFAPAETPDERMLYPELYEALLLQRQNSMGVQ